MGADLLRNVVSALTIVACLSPIHARAGCSDGRDEGWDQQRCMSCQCSYEVKKCPGGGWYTLWSYSEPCHGQQPPPTQGRDDNSTKKRNTSPNKNRLRRSPPEENIADGAHAATAEQSRPEDSGTCSGNQDQAILAAFRLAGEHLANAYNRLDDYIAHPSAKANACVAAGLRSNFAAADADTASTVRDNIQTLMDGFGKPVRPSHCASENRKSPDGALINAAPGEPGTNHFTYYPVFFSRHEPRRGGGGFSLRDTQAKTVVHEMVHSHMDVGVDGYYVFEKGYPGPPQGAVNNPDSYGLFAVGLCR
jgi:hypothetical protein